MWTSITGTEAKIVKQIHLGNMLVTLKANALAMYFDHWSRIIKYHRKRGYQIPGHKGTCGGRGVGRGSFSACLASCPCLQIITTFPNPRSLPWKSQRYCKALAWQSSMEWPRPFNVSAEDQDCFFPNHVTNILVFVGTNRAAETQFRRVSADVHKRAIPK